MFHASKTAQSYLGDVVNFASWAKTNPVAIRQSWHLLGTPNEIRSLISFFLAVEMKCVVVLGKDKLGFETKRIEPTWETSRRLERLFAALRSFYNVLRSKGLYIYENPMEGQGARDLIADERRRVESEFFQANGRHSMNPESGVDPIRLERMSAAYFRLRGDKWTPFIIDDPLLFNIILSAGEKWGWTLREIGIVRLLFDTGCRIHEACNLTMGDWSHSGFQKELMAISKGSHGRRVKRLFITDRTVKVLQQYVDEQRKELDPERRTLSEMGKLPSSTLRALPLF
jgi:integrase